MTKAVAISSNLIIKIQGKRITVKGVHMIVISL